MGSQLSAEDLALISKHIGGIFDQRINSTEEILSKSMKALQEVHEVNHTSLYKEMKAIKNELSEVKETGLKTENHTKVTNGRVTKLEDKVDGEKNSNGKIVNQGLIVDMQEIKKYRFIYKDWYRILVAISLLSSLFIKESRDWIFGFLKFFKGI